MKAILILLCAVTTAPVQFKARDLSGKDVLVPATDRPTVVTFLRIGQTQSTDAFKQLAEVVAKRQAVQVVVAISGPNADEATRKFVADAKIAFPVVLDPDYALSGKMNVHVWPTTVIVASDGTQAAHLAGLPQSFSSDLSAYLDFAAKRIDKTALDSRLTTKQVITDSPQQAATRHLRIASTLLEKEQFPAALAEVDEGLKLAPSDPSLRLFRVRVLLKQKQPQAALEAAEQLKDVAPPWQINLLRAEALVALERWSDAKTAAADAIKLNPNPASAYYLSGLISSHENDWPHAAEAFRKAYEATAKRN